MAGVVALRFCATNPQVCALLLGALANAGQGVASAGLPAATAEAMQVLGGAAAAVAQGTAGAIPALADAAAALAEAGGPLAAAATTLAAALAEAATAAEIAAWLAAAAVATATVAAAVESLRRLLEQGPPEPPGEDEPEEEERRRRACVDGAPDLPSGRLPDAQHFIAAGRHFLKGHFRMRIRFRNDDTGCECGRGEYLQLVSGRYWKTDVTGAEHVLRHYLRSPSELLERGSLKEDSRVQGVDMPYGHRYEDDLTRQVPRPNDYDSDQFRMPIDRVTGCAYHGYDNPGIEYPVDRLSPGEGIHFDLSFRGMAIDGVDGRPVSRAHEWSVRGHHTEPQGAIEPPQTTPTSPPTPQPPTGTAGARQSGRRDDESCDPADIGGLGRETRGFMDRHLWLGSDDIRQATEMEYEFLHRCATEEQGRYPGTLRDLLRRYGRGRLRGIARLRVLRYAFSAGRAVRSAPRRLFPRPRYPGIGVPGSEP